MADIVLCLVGGIGITNALGFVQEYANANIQRDQDSGKTHGIMKKAKRFILAWSARERGLIEHVKRNFLLQPGDIDGIEYEFWCTGPSETGADNLDTELAGSKIEKRLNPRSSVAITPRRMDIRSVIRSALEEGLQATVLVCGPSSMADEATRQVVDCVKDGLRVDMIEESFAW